MLTSIKKIHNSHFYKILLGLAVIGLNFSVPVMSQSTIFKQSSLALSSQEQAELQQGKVILKGENGEYTGQVIAQGSPEKAWEVLTDYNNFKNFLPNIVSSKILQQEAQLTIFEQVSSVDLWLLTKQFTVQIAAKKTEYQKIDFELVKGDLGNLKGTWEIKVLPSKQVLITHRVSVMPKSSSEAAIFYGIYESSLEETLQAIALEIAKRSQSKMKTSQVSQ